MRLAKKVRGTVETSESFKGKLAKTIEEEALCCRTSYIYQGEEDQSFSIRSSSESKMTCTKRGGEQFVTEEIIEEGNRWPNIEWVVPSAIKDVIQFIGLECGIFKLSNKVGSVGGQGM
ncbi:hypothetical protein Tco_1285066 [Tanacetum coccineum]